MVQSYFDREFVRVMRLFSLNGGFTIICWWSRIDQESHILQKWLDFFIHLFYYIAIPFFIRRSRKAKITQMYQVVHAISISCPIAHRFAWQCSRRNPLTIPQIFYGLPFFPTLLFKIALLRKINFIIKNLILLYTVITLVPCDVKHHRWWIIRNSIQ